MRVNRKIQILSQNRIQALRVPSSPDSNLPQPIKAFVEKFFNNLKNKPTFEYKDISPVKMKKGYKEAVYFQVVIRVDPKREDKNFTETFNAFIEYEGVIPGDIRLVSIPETSGAQLYPEYNADFIYYRGRL